MFLKRAVAILSITLSSQIALSPISIPASAIGGGETALGDPRVVAIILWQRNGIGEVSCSGALIAPRIVMTSAHCLSRNPLDGKFPSYSTALPKSGVLTESDAPLWVVTPGAKVDLSENIPRARAIAQFPSPLYRDSYCLKENPNQCYGSIYDFGVIVLDRALSSNTYRVANVEELRELVQKNSEIVGLGYGLTSHEEYLGKSKRDGIPRKISYKVRSDLLQVDKARFSYYPELMLLQTTYRSGQYTCGGDSGMPGWFEKNGEWIYIGAAGSGMGPECSYAPDDPFWKDPFWSINAGDHYDTAQAYPEEISAAYSFLADQTNKERIEAEAKAAAEKAAAELKAKQEAEAKAAAEKAAAELKAKQEAETKAAAELKSKQEAEAKAKAEAAKKKTTITCVKGKITKKVTGVNPKCPAGYRKNR